MHSDCWADLTFVSMSSMCDRLYPSETVDQDKLSPIRRFCHSILAEQQKSSEYISVTISNSLSSCLGTKHFQLYNLSSFQMY